MRAWGTALITVLAAGAAIAQEGTDLAPERAPLPEARPGDVEEAIPQFIPPASKDAEVPTQGGEGADPAPTLSAAEPTADEEPAEGLSFGLDGAEESDDAETSPTEESLPEESPPPAPDEAAAEPEVDLGPPMPEVLAETEAELTACIAALDSLGVTYERADPIQGAENRDCGIVNPLTVSEIAPGVALDPPPTLRCDAALAAARWVADVALPLSRKLEGRGPLIALDQGTAYLCRPRADGETSEHAYGNALDVMAFRFETGDPIVVQPRADDGTLEEAFQTAVEGGACLDFTTVLGPGQEDHDDHLHLDVKERDGGFRICQ